MDGILHSMSFFGLQLSGNLGRTPWFLGGFFYKDLLSWYKIIKDNRVFRPYLKTSLYKRNAGGKRYEMVFCYQNCSDLLVEKIVLVIKKTFEIRGWRCKIFEITWTIYSKSERSEQFLVTECFFNLLPEISQI